MSRPINEGLLYFPFDCDFFANKKTKIIRAHFGADGVIVFLYILCDIYKNGYFIEVDKDYTDIISTDLNIAKSRIKDILDFFADRNIFDSDLYKKFNVISSKDIQLCFQAAIKGRAKKNPRYVQNYWILAENETADYILFSDNSENNNSNSENNPFELDSNSENYAINKIKENKIKINKNKIKEKQTKEKEVGLGLVVDFYKKSFGEINQEETNRLAELLDRYEDKLLMECISIAVNKDVKKLSYIIGILKNLDKNGITTIEQYERSKRNDSTSRTNENDSRKHTEEYGTTV